jgi:hypothetical protein
LLRLLQARFFFKAICARQGHTFDVSMLYYWCKLAILPCVRGADLSQVMLSRSIVAPRHALLWQTFLLNVREALML